MLAEHLVAISDEFAVWRQVCVRGAGFPARDVLAVAMPALAAAIDRRLAGDLAALDDAGLAKLFDRERARVSIALRARAADRRLREAIAWQNPGALRTGLDPLLRQPPDAHNSSTRRKERLVASYLQRYSVKNDSIGFFGPVGWARFVDDGPAIAMRPGPSLLARRTIYFEHWTVAALAERLGARAEIRRQLAPRLHPGVRLDGARLLHPGGAVDLPAEAAALLAACDGERTAAELSVVTGGDVTAALDELVTAGLLLWSLDVPTVGQPYEAALRARLEALADADAGAAALADLDDLTVARDGVAAAAGDPDALDQALAGLDATFVRIVGGPTTRGAGQTYAGRTLVYEDCRRDLGLDLGPTLRARLGPPLSLLLVANRWFSFETARRYRPALAALHRALAPDGGPVELARFWPQAAAMFPRVGGVAPPDVAALPGEYQQRWQAVLELDGDYRHQVRRADELAPRVAAAFAAPCAGFPTARYHSPDILIAASSPEAAARGDLTFVIGEIHASLNTLEQEVLFQEHPAQDAMLAALARDLPDGRIAPAVPASDAGRCRPTPYSQHPRDVTVEFDATRSHRPRAQTVTIAELVVTDEAGTLIVATRDGARRWDLIVALDSLLSEFSIPLLPDAVHTPRVAIDDLVIQRETWCVPVAELGFVHDDDVLRRFVAMRQVAQARGWPRFLFYKVAGEVKPCFLDLDSPILVENFTKIVRGEVEVTLSEMLPSIEETWLVDGDGQTYTSELRLVAVDQRVEQ